MPGERTIRDRDGALEATFIPELGMVASSLRDRGEELLWQAGGTMAYARRGATFALPLLYPWANRLSGWSYAVAGAEVALDPGDPLIHRDGATGLPIHGLLAASPHWRLHDAGEDSLVAELDFGSIAEYMRAFPFAHRIRYEASVADATLSVSVTVTATGERPVPVSFGFHPYLTLPGSDRRDWQITLPVARQATLDQQMIPTGQGVEIAPGALDGALGERTFDTAFDALRGGDGGAPPVFAVADGRRRLTVELRSGYPVAQVYAPRASGFICFEPMTAPIDALRSGVGLHFAEPDRPLSARFAIAVR